METTVTWLDYTVSYARTFYSSSHRFITLPGGEVNFAAVFK
jgi:hypothetical protein